MQKQSVGMERKRGGVLRQCPLRNTKCYENVGAGTIPRLYVAAPRLAARTQYHCRQKDPEASEMFAKAAGNWHSGIVEGQKQWFDLLQCILGQDDICVATLALRSNTDSDSVDNLRIADPSHSGKVKGAHLTMHTTVAPKDIKVWRGVLFVCFAANHSEVIIVPSPYGARQNPLTFWNSCTRALIPDTIMKLSGTIGMTFYTHVCLILLQTLNPQGRWGTRKKRWPFQPRPFGDVIGLVRCSHEVNQQSFSNFAMQTRFWATLHFICQSQNEGLGYVLELPGPPISPRLSRKTRMNFGTVIWQCWAE